MKKLFSLDWFKSERQIELEKLKVEEQSLRNKVLKKELENPSSIDGQVSVNIQEKLYTSLKLVNNVISLVMKDGTVLTKTEATVQDFHNIKNANTETEILSIMFTFDKVKKLKKEEVKQEIEQKASESIDVLKAHSDFVVEDGSVYLATMYNSGVKRSIPALLVNKFVKVLNTDEFDSLKKFWLKCCLNPNAQSAEDLYEFLTFHQFKIDRHGNFYAYRRVVSKQETDTDLVDFISNAYNKVKAVWKKNPAHYNVYSDNGYVLVDGLKQNHGYNNFVGDLKDLYLDLPNLSSNTYTSAHTGKEDYKVGSVISMPRDEGDDNNTISCSRGFHAASKEYDYSSFGDTPILVIINPMDVLSVPKREVGKLRTCRWFFAMTLTEEEQHILDDEDFDVADLGDVFEENCSQDLENYVHNSFVEEVKRHTFNIPTMSNTQIRNIVKSLDEMKNEIKKRVQTII